MGKSLQRIQITFGAMYITVTIVFTIVVSSLLLGSLKRTAEKSASDFISADAHQIELNIDNFLETVETVCSLLYSDEAYYGYYDTNPDLSDYDKVIAKDAITTRIIDLGMMMNFSDFGVIYSNDRSAGWISQTTGSMFTNGGTYDYFSSLITDPLREEGWATNVMGNNDRIYFIKRLNPNAIAVLSIYTNELNSVFSVPDELSAMTVRMVDSTGTIIYSTDESEIAMALPSDISMMIGDQTGISALDSNYVVTSNNLSNGWRLVTSISTSYLMKDEIAITTTVSVMIIIVSLLIVLFQLIVLKRYNRSVANVVVNLEDKAATDLMTGLLNKTSFRLQAESDLKIYNGKQSTVFIIMDLDNFKSVNDQLGHKVGDDVIVSMGNILKEIFSENFVRVGRIGGDEFAVYCSFVDKKQERAEEWAKYKTERLYVAFEKKFKDKIEQFDLSISMGVLVEGAGDHLYDDLYKRADTALYVSKRNGKGKPTYL